MATRMPTARRRRSTRALRPHAQIARLHIKGLYGKLDYDSIPIFGEKQSESRISILYGDNGTGKTTILKLVYACLSPQAGMGLRTLISQTPFEIFAVYLVDGTRIQVEKASLVGNYQMSFIGTGINRTLDVFASPDGRVLSQEATIEVEKLLRQIGFDILFVDHNRVVKSTYAFISEIPISDRSMPRGLNDIQREHLLQEATLMDVEGIDEDDLRFPLPQVVDAIERWFRAQAFRQGAVGEQSAAGVYLEIVKSIIRRRNRKNVNIDFEVLDVPSVLDTLKHSTLSFIRHGLLSEYPFDELIDLYQTASNNKKVQIEAVLRPFLDTIQRRVSALQNIHDLITLLEDEISKYLSNKRVTIHILYGLQIFDDEGVIDLESLSSGEKQLVFLLCAAALSRSRQSLILIDEPELSLNYKWQRLIASSLANISHGSGTQYILASHSIEIITRYADTSFELVG